MNGLANIWVPAGVRRRLPLLNPHGRVISSSPMRRVVSLVSLSRRLPDEFIAQTLAEALCRESNRSVLLVQFVQADGSLSLRDWRTLYPSLNGEFGLAAQIKTGRGRAPFLRLEVSDGADDASGLATLVEHCRRHFDYVLCHLGPDVAPATLTEAIHQGDIAYLFLEPAAENFYHRDLLLRELRSRFDEDKIAPPHTIVCREAGEEHGNQLLKSLGPAVHGFIHACPKGSTNAPIAPPSDKQFNSDIRRLAREIAQRRIGLALSSGGARSLAHIGVIQVLEENGIEVDVVAGCSMGAYVGSVWAYGCSGIEMER